MYRRALMKTRYNGFSSHGSTYCHAFSGHRGAEALLRIPDDYTQKALIRDKMSAANGDSPLGHSEPVIREAVNQAMRIVGRQFVMGRSIEEALDRANSLERLGYRYSYDMLGEAARTLADSDRFYDSCVAAIDSLGRHAGGKGGGEGPGNSTMTLSSCNR